MSRLLTVTGLALRELWISFRLLAAVGAVSISALPATLVSGVPAGLLGSDWTPLRLFAVGLAAALSVVAALAAIALAGERRRGTIGWLVSRSVPRSLVVLGWFSAFVIVLLLGSRLPGVTAGLVTLVLVAAALVPAAAGLAPDLAASPAPAAGLAVLGVLLEATRPIADSLRSAGLSLVIAAALLVLGAAALGRADL